MASDYLSRHRFLPRQLPIAPSSDLGIVVVIPCHAEPDLGSSLDALWQANQPACGVEVIVVVNASEASPPDVLKQNTETAQLVRSWAAKHQRTGFSCHLIEQHSLPAKHAGVGLARKIGMDEAIDRFGQAGSEHGIIACFDADSQCQPNYFAALLTAFAGEARPEAVSLHFEHPLQGDAFSPEVYAAIAGYELFLRYYIEAQRFAGHPHAHQTIGSSMAVTAAAYQRVGGMNRRKAGEDFYFLQKIIATGSVADCATTTVIPSPRPSNRVPFGTGKAVADWLTEPKHDFPTYSFQIFEDLRAWCQLVPVLAAHSRSELTAQIAGLPDSISTFLVAQDAVNQLMDIQSKTASKAAFEKRVYQWLNAFQVLKFVHYATAHFYPREPLTEVVASLLAQAPVKPVCAPEVGDQLRVFRTAARSGGLFPVPKGF